MNAHTREELAYRQALPLSMKVAFTKTRIREWINHYSMDGVYEAYSGGMGSKVLSHLIDETYPDNDIPRVFVDTGLEYPEVRQFAMKEPRCVVVKPKMNFKQVIEKYGYPFVSKEVSECVYGAKQYLTKLLAENPNFDRQTDSCRMRTSIANSEELANILNRKMKNREGGQNQRLAQMLGMLTLDQTIKANIPDKDRSMFSFEKWAFFLDEDAPPVSQRCCTVMKKEPSHRYSHETGRVVMTGEMASESRLRTQKWLQHGCNGFDLKEPKSTPLATWTYQDLLLYIKLHNIEICSVYGDIVTDYAKDGQLDGQVSLTDLSDEYGLFDLGNLPLKTTGCERTGCMFCGYGCHLEKEGKGRFEMMKKTHPKIYDYIMRPKEEGGLNYKEVIDWINEHGNLNIRY